MYTNIDNNIISKLQNSAKHKMFTKKEKDFLTSYIPKTCNFYRLPKVHKSKEIEIAVETQKSE